MLQSGSRTDRTVDMLMAAERALIQNRCLNIPTVYVRPEVDKTTGVKVKEVVRRHQGTVVENEADATHIIYPPVDPMEEEYARPCMKRERSVLLHWYYFPDSYDSWTTLDLPWDYPEGTLMNTNSRCRIHYYITLLHYLLMILLIKVSNVTVNIRNGIGDVHKQNRCFKLRLNKRKNFIYQ